MAVFKGFTVFLIVCLALMECAVVKKSKTKPAPVTSNTNELPSEGKTNTTTIVTSKTIEPPKEGKPNSSTTVNESPKKVQLNVTIPCTCGVFLSGQFVKGSTAQPTGDPALILEVNKVFPCNPIGQKQCQTKCLETIVSHLPNSANVLCATLDRDCHKERAYLFIKNCKDSWINTNLAAGKEYCCKDGEPYSCPLV